MAKSGDDSSPGTASEPWATISHAADMARAGDTIHVTAGTYAESVRFVHPGEPENLIRCIGEGDVLVNAEGADWGLFVDGYEDNNGKYVEIDGVSVTNATRGGIRISWANDTIIKNCESFTNGRWGIFTDYADDIQLLDNNCHDNIEEHGIYVSNSGDRPLIRGNICWNNAGAGIQINADPAMEGDGITSKALVEDNICYNNGELGGAAINLASVRDSVIRNNLLYGNHAGGIACWGDGNGPDWGCKDNVFVNNTIVFDSDEGRWCLSLKEASTNAVILNNILIGGRRGALEFSSDSLNGMQSDYNIMHSLSGNTVVTEEDVSWLTLPEWQNGGQDTHTTNTSPDNLFESLSTIPFQLMSGSSAVDSGAENHPDIPSVDISGQPRFNDPGSPNTGEGSGLTDRGCYELAITPGEVSVTISMPAKMYSPGDPCWCKVSVLVEEDENLIGYLLIVLLDVFGVFFFAPSFNTEFDSYALQYTEFLPGETVVEVLPSFDWPAGAGFAAGICWYAGIVDPAITILVSNAAAFEFSWEE
ncbi:right-handed parallel beta-helix repeat-containing protein [bacterium]|nr:right-handed parallel beta-helix repeat-containing protein [bacterium]